ncbi:MAG: NosD domain-containing protein, partial [Promethearchaeota archaeon]
MFVFILINAGKYVSPKTKQNNKNTIIDDISNINIKNSPYWTITPIQITNWTEAAIINSWCSFDSQEGKFVIENVTIDATGSNYGILINNSQTDSFIIRNCTIRNSVGGYNSAGIILNNSSLGEITNNTLFNNSFNGILLKSSSYFNITQNKFELNNECGLNISDILCNEIYIYDNKFLNNGINAQDNSLYGSNFWNSTDIGNIWDDYPGKDENDNNIGDDPYLIGGIAGNLDYLPIFWDAPFFTLNSPNNYSLLGKNASTFNLTITEGLGDYIWYEFIGLGSSTPSTLLGNEDEEYSANFEQSLWVNGTHTIRFYINDSRNFQYTIDLILHIDKNNPNITILEDFSSYYAQTPPYFFVSIVDDVEIHKMWYQLNDNLTKHFFDTNSSINSLIWQIVEDGIVNITFYANDTAGNIKSEMVQVFKDTEDPYITNNEVGGDNEWHDAPPGPYDVDFHDDTSNLLYIQYRITGDVDGTIVYQDWTNISTDIYASDYTANWYVNFSGCKEGTNYISVRAFDVAGNSDTFDNVFYVLKD